MIKPMLAVDAILDKIRYPVLVQEKIDGVRAFNYQGILYTRTGKPFPNLAIREKYSKLEYHGYDGEIYDGKSFISTSALCRSIHAHADVEWHVFDTFASKEVCYTERMEEVNYYPKVKCMYAWHKDGLRDCQNLFIEGEGLILRNPNSPYKFGRSTMKDQALMRIKNFDYNAARVLLVNARITKEGEILREVGSLICMFNGQEITVSAGRMSKEERILYFCKDFIGRKITFKHLPTGAGERPRFPTFQSVVK